LFVKMCIVVGDPTIKSVMFGIPLLGLTHATGFFLFPATYK